MITKKLSEIVKQYYINGRVDEDFIMNAITHTLGGEVKRASSRDDKKIHVDFWWESPRKGRIGIDAKGIKKNSRIDKCYDDTIHWLELKSVAGNDGWLYGKADYIAFRTFTKILFVKRETLLDFALKCIDGKEISVGRNPNECYVPYQRYGRKDLIIKVKTTDLEKLSEFCIDCE